MQNCRAAPSEPFVPRYSEAPPDIRCTALWILPKWAPSRFGLKKPTPPTKINTTPTRVATVFAIVSPCVAKRSELYLILPTGVVQTTQKVGERRPNELEYSATTDDYEDNDAAKVPIRHCLVKFEVKIGICHPSTQQT